MPVNRFFIICLLSDRKVLRQPVLVIYHTIEILLILMFAVISLFSYLFQKAITGEPEIRAGTGLTPS